MWWRVRKWWGKCWDLKGSAKKLVETGAIDLVARNSQDCSRQCIFYLASHVWGNYKNYYNYYAVRFWEGLIIGCLILFHFIAQAQTSTGTLVLKINTRSIFLAYCVKRLPRFNVFRTRPSMNQPITDNCILCAIDLVAGISQDCSHQCISYLVSQVWGNYKNCYNYHANLLQFCLFFLITGRK